MAVDAVAASKAKKVIIVAGTAYHVGQGEDFEELIAESAKAEAFSGQEFVEVDGVIFHFKHHVGSSSIPHGRHTPVARDAVWNALWAEQGRQPRARVICRSHVHYFSHCGGSNWDGFTTPALQAANTYYGRRCSGLVDFGFLVFKCHKGGFTWEARLLKPAAERAHLLRV
jgi:hypothetical protein